MEGQLLQSRAMAEMDPERLVRAGDLIGLAGIAGRLHVSERTVSSWRLRFDDFPAPAPIEGIDRVVVWAWPDVEAWHDAHRHLLGRGTRTDLS